MTNTKGRGRPRKVTSSPTLLENDSFTSNSSLNSETSDTTMENSDSTATITSVEETNFVQEETSREVIHTPTRRMESFSRVKIPEEHNERNAVKLNNLQDKVTRYESHRYFLETCIKDGLTPTSLKNFIEPSIGNHDEEFLTKWYQIQKDCANKLMQLTVEFCNTTIAKTNDVISKTEDSLRMNTDGETFDKIKNEIKTVQQKTANQLNRKKKKKIHYLKYGIHSHEEQQNSKPPVKTTSKTRNNNKTNNEIERPSTNQNYKPTKPTYASILLKEKDQPNQDIRNKEIRAPRLSFKEANRNNKTEQTKNQTGASFQRVGGVQIINQLVKGIEYVTETTNALKEQLQILLEQQDLTHLEM